MKILKRFVALLLTAVICFNAIGCDNKNNARKNDKGKYKLTILTTLFPYYDFARAIVGETEDINVELLVSPGQDNHSFEPTPADVIAIDEADVFIYNGGSIENWVSEVLQSLDNQEQKVLKMMDYVEVLEEEQVEGMDTRFEEHEHEEDEHEKHEEFDEHIWTSPVSAQILTQKICDELCKMSPENAENFQKNAKDYIARLQGLNDELHQIVNDAENREIIFADKFPLLYFAKEYDLKYYAAFPGCGDDMEPSARTIAFLIDKIREDKVKAVFYLELSSQTVADTISEDTGAKTLQFNSCHNITQKQFDAGITYVDLMKENVDSLRTALN